MDYYTPVMHDSNWGWGLLMILFWLLVIVAIAYVTLRLLKENKPIGSTKVHPMDIAKERYAKGEITKEQFNEIKKEVK